MNPQIIAQAGHQAPVNSIRKKVFIGSSSESKEQATKIAEAISSPVVEPVLWWEWFDVGDITFLGIEELASEITGAILLATPDDSSRIRGKDVMTPRANVLFEYGYLTAALGRKRVALCRYHDAELPSDFDGLTYVSMGNFVHDADIELSAKQKLCRWVGLLTPPVEGIPPTSLLNGLSGHWRFENTYNLWRGIKIDCNDDYVVLDAVIHLTLSCDGSTGSGCIVGRLQVQIGQCHAKFDVCDIIREARVTSDGGLFLRSEAHSRQLVGQIIGTPPQSDGFEPELKGARIFDYHFSPQPNAERTLTGKYQTIFAGIIRSEGCIRIWR